MNMLGKSLCILCNIIYYILCVHDYLHVYFSTGKPNTKATESVNTNTTDRYIYIYIYQILRIVCILMMYIYDVYDHPGTELAIVCIMKVCWIKLILTTQN